MTVLDVIMSVYVALSLIVVSGFIWLALYMLRSAR